MVEYEIPDEDPSSKISSHEFGALNTLMFVGLLMLCIVAGYWLDRTRFGYLPESGAVMLIGAVAGFVITRVMDDAELELLQFSPLIFFFVLLPPIIFEAGYTLKKKRFFSNLSAIVCYAVAGTFISTVVVGLLTYAVAATGLIGVDRSSPLQSLLFGALISSVDPVATLAILGSNEVNCDPLLYSLVFGESVLNDAVAIVLFHVMNSYASESKTFEARDVLIVLFRFCAVALVSVLIGILCGLVCSLIFKSSHLSRFHAYEIQMLFFFSFGSFALAELAHMSGVVALFFCAVTLAHYNYYNLSVQTKISSKYVFESLAKTSETVVFLYMGVSIFISRSSWEPMFVVLGILFCIVARAANIFPMTLLANLCRTEKITKNMQVFMFFSGLRGAVSYALAQQISQDTGSIHGIQVIQTTTLGIVIFTTFFLGGTTSFALERLDLKRGESRERGGSDNQLREDFSNYHEMPSASSPQVSPDLDEDFSSEAGSISSMRIRLARRQAHAFWRRVDDNFMKPWFGGKRHQKSRISPELYNAIQDGDFERLNLNGETAALTRDSFHGNGSSMMRVGHVDNEDVDGEEDDERQLELLGMSDRSVQDGQRRENGHSSGETTNTTPLI